MSDAPHPGVVTRVRAALRGERNSGALEVVTPVEKALEVEAPP